MNYQSFSREQKLKILHDVEMSTDKEAELIRLGVAHSTYYAWRRAGGETQKKTPHRIWNQTPAVIEERIKEYRLSEDPRQHSPARIVEQLEAHEHYLMTESGVKSVLERNKLNGFLKPKKKHFYIRSKAEKFLQVVCADDVEFIRHKPRDTYILNFIDEASYFSLSATVRSHRTNQRDIIAGLQQIKRTHGRYPKTLRLDNARAHHALRVARFCDRHGIALDFITTGCPEENWPVESWHRNLNQDLIYRHGYATLREWQLAVEQYRHFHNHEKRLRSDPLTRTPAEIASAQTSPATQAKLKIQLMRKFYGQKTVKRSISDEVFAGWVKSPYFKPYSVSKMCVS